jgi:hypothetical protein
MGGGERGGGGGGGGGGGKNKGVNLFHLDLAKVMRGDDTRTTLMIRNIPNKYSQKMLLSTVDEKHKGKYDFLYLPIDFKNKCNVGYAFINFICPKSICDFHATFNHRKWDKFNSDKVRHCIPLSSSYFSSLSFSALLHILSFSCAVQCVAGLSFCTFVLSPCTERFENCGVRVVVCRPDLFLRALLAGVRAGVCADPGQAVSDHALSEQFAHDGG